MGWKDKLDECCADELEEMMVDSVRAGFLSDDDILEDCVEYIEDEYPDDCGDIEEGELLEVIGMLRDKYQNTGNQENFLRLDSVFRNLEKRGVVALHCAGYTQSDGFDDCNELARERHENGEKVTGCCFYTMQDVEHILHEESTKLHISFGNYFDVPTAAEVGQIIIEELEAAGFLTEWDGTADRRIAVKDFIWDKCYIDEE